MRRARGEAVPRRVIVAESSMLIDAEQGCVKTVAFTLWFGISVPDLLYESELKPYGDRLLALGLEVLQLDGAGVHQAVQYRRHVPSLSLSQTFALVLARTIDTRLLTDEACLRHLAGKEGVACHDSSWLCQRIRCAQEERRERSQDALVTPYRQCH